MAEDLALDLEELRHLQLASHSQTTSRFVSGEVIIRRIFCNGTTYSSYDFNCYALNYASLGSFSWDQDGGKVKNMYEEGDEEMKKTIEKAWTDARSGKRADPLSSYR